jgi:hypothetical protein
VFDWIKENFPGHPWVLMRKAEDCVREQDWAQVVALLRDLSLEGVDDGTACHIGHLLGIGLFQSGEIADAVQTWQQAAQLDRGDCELEDLLEYGRVAGMSAAERARSRKKGHLPTVLCALEDLDGLLERGEWAAAVSLAESSELQCERGLQVWARIAEAFLHLEVEAGSLLWFRKIIVLAEFCLKQSEFYLGNEMDLPPYLHPWPEERIQEVQKSACEWLDGPHPVREAANPAG